MKSTNEIKYKYYNDMIASLENDIGALQEKVSNVNNDILLLLSQAYSEEIRSALILKYNIVLDDISVQNAEIQELIEELIICKKKLAAE